MVPKIFSGQVESGRIIFSLILGFYVRVNYFLNKFQLQP